MQFQTEKGLLRFIGTGSAFNYNLGNNSAYLKRNSTLILLDCGGTVFHRIQGLNLLQGVKNLYVIITHLHPDHVGSLGDLIFYTHYMLQLKTTVIYPDLAALNNLLTTLGVTDNFYSTMAINKNITIENSDIKIDIEFVPQKHTDTLKSFGYILTFDTIKLFYGGDSSNIPDEIYNKFSTGEISFLYQDTCSYDFPNIPHMSLYKLTQCIESNLRSRVYCMHLDNSFDTAKAEALGFNVVKSE